MRRLWRESDEAGKYLAFTWILLGVLSAMFTVWFYVVDGKAWMYALGSMFICIVYVFVSLYVGRNRAHYHSKIRELKHLRGSNG